MLLCYFINIVLLSTNKIKIVDNNIFVCIIIEVVENEFKGKNI